MATERGTPQLSGSTSLAAGVGLSRPFYIVLVSSPASAPLYINQRNYSPCQAVVVRNAWLEARRNKVGFVSLPSFCTRGMGGSSPAVGQGGNRVAVTPKDTTQDSMEQLTVLVPPPSPSGCVVRKSLIQKCGQDARKV